MRDSHRFKEKYEVALDDRQIVTLTVASFVVLGGVFMLGVVVGKKLAGERSERASADWIGQVDQKTAALDSLKEKEREGADLTFHDELTKKVPSALAADEKARAAPPKPPAEKEARKQELLPAPSAATAGPSSGAPTGASASNGAGGGAGPAPAVSAVALARLPEAPKSEPIATRTSDGGGLREAFGKVQRAPAEAPASGGWTVQLAAYQERSDADRFAAGLRDKGYAPYIVEVRLANKGVWYRVRMGRFGSKDAASRYMDDFKRETGVSAIVTAAAP